MVGEENVHQEVKNRVVDVTALAVDSASSGLMLGLQLALEHRELAVEALSQFANAFGREAVLAMREGMEGMLLAVRELGWEG